MASEVQELESVWSAFHANQLDRASQLADALLEKSNDNGRLWEVRGLIHHRCDEAAQCAHALEVASLLVPLRTSSSICLAGAYGQLGHIQLARDLYLQLAENGQPETETLLQIAAGLDAIDRPDDAGNICRAALKQDPFDAQAYYDLGYYAIRTDCPFPVVKSLLSKAVSLAPDRVSYRVGLAQLLRQNGCVQDAHAMVRQLTASQMSEIRCTCCLQRIAALFDEIGDNWRARYCRRQMQQHSV